jgi:hypothetical protein
MSHSRKLTDAELLAKKTKYATEVHTNHPGEYPEMDKLALAGKHGPGTTRANPSTPAQPGKKPTNPTNPAPADKKPVTPEKGVPEVKEKQPNVTPAHEKHEVKSHDVQS